MKHYIELTLLPAPDFNLFKLWSRVFEQLHLGFVENQDENKRVPIGLSLPEYKMGDKYGVLGDKIRLFAADQATLERFNAPQRLARLSDYVHCTGIRPVPDKLLGYAVYRRVQPKTNPERLARRYAKRHGVDLATALNMTVELRAASENPAYPLSFRYCDMLKPSVPWPFIRLQSKSGGQTFCLWIAKTAAAAPVAGSFSAYGLSSVATVPEF
ncbi:type I-F CRISPR-associated endoribonuclease Cas6/Csy4 [Methylomonas sp. SURF-2]|uniref:Type I-F CRISPR-associated endoribonuclease Cas6/Csy4 n=1 Tax=Methylomonas subterranea TaxID=2952225 RepID=A0ABT1TJV3_9GAMM|nr:type I-F CRISPR-associated endoribonuclease Cas6/Csy4 [Methylomonas sp. SURF-2]MCQ8105757.1 type I-F CRISPR-associated endoribonuclease Cas6/Csy4 [Methylomonas sp. SURF-2]